VKRRKTWDKITFNLVSYVFIVGFAVFCVLPFIIMLSGSLSSQTSIVVHGYTLWPRDFSLDAYELLFSDPDIMLSSFTISVIVTALGTVISLFVCSMAAYVLGRKNFRIRNKVAFMYYFTTLFSGGLVSYYIIMINYYGMKNNLLALILPATVNVWNLLVLRNFMTNNVPDSLIESAKIDGAGEFRIYARIVMPLMVPSLMAIGFFTAISYWNDWYSAMLFIDKEQLVPLQYRLYRLLNTLNTLIQIAARHKGAIRSISLPTETIKLAMAIVAAAPIMFLYSFIQKYFVKGIMVGAIKG
jgi:putative aldouronate transport system permease protein